MDFANYWFSSGEASAGGDGGEFEVTLFDSGSGLKNSIVSNQGPNTLILFKGRDVDGVGPGEWRWVFPSVGMDKMILMPGTHDIDDYADPTEPGNYVAYSWGLSESYTGENVINGFKTASGSVSVCKYQGTGKAQPVAHGLNGIPEFVFVRRLGSYEQIPASFGVQSIFDQPGQATYLRANDYIKNLDSSRHTYQQSNVYNFVDETRVGISKGGISNSSSYEYVMCSFKSVPGVSALGSYQGNSSSNGPTISCGFTPDFVVVAQMYTDSGGRSWVTADLKRQTELGLYYPLLLDSRNTETQNQQMRIEIVNNGFRPRTSNNNVNENPFRYFYMAFKIPE